MDGWMDGGVGGWVDAKGANFEGLAYNNIDALQKRSAKCFQGSKVLDPLCLSKRDRIHAVCQGLGVTYASLEAYLFLT